MRQLSGGDIAAKLGRIEKSNRGRKWRKKAAKQLLKGQEIRPCNKRRYNTQELAEQALNDTQWIASISTRRKEQRLYYCNNCSGFHLTSQEYMPNGHQEG